MKAIVPILLASLLPVAINAAEPEMAPTNNIVEPYLRIDESQTNKVELQIALRQFVPESGKGPVIWLAAVAHIGESNYFSRLQTHLENHELVLFEGIMPKRKTAWTGKEFAMLQKSMPIEPEDAGLQTQLADALGLAFQLSAIDYDKANYRNSDLAYQDLQHLMSGRQGSPATKSPSKKPEAKKDKTTDSPLESPTDQPGKADKSDETAAKSDASEGDESNDSFNQLMAVMHGEGLFGNIVKFGVAMIAANPKLQAITKLTFVEVLGGLKGDLAQTKAVPPQLAQLLKVLIHSRNQKVTQDLQKELRRENPPASISVFYGAGHMDDLERRVRKQLKYKPKKDIWVPAFSVDLETSGISTWEREMVRFMTQRQLQMLSPQQ